MDDQPDESHPETAWNAHQADVASITAAQAVKRNANEAMIELAETLERLARQHRDNTSDHERRPALTSPPREQRSGKLTLEIVGDADKLERQGELLALWITEPQEIEKFADLVVDLGRVTHVNAAVERVTIPAPQP